MMDSSANLSGETLFLRQAPLVLECQSPAWKLCSTGVQRPARPCSLNLAYTISLPVPPQLLQQQQSQQNPDSKKQGRGDKEPERMRACFSPAPDLSGGSSPTGLAVGREKPTGDRGTPRWVNPFIPEEERNEEEEEEEEDDLEGDNLHKYQEDFSFQLHGDSRVEEEAPMYKQNQEPSLHHGTENVGARRNMWSRERGVSKELEHLTQPGVEFRPRCDSRGTPMLIDCGELEWGGSGDSSGGGGGGVTRQRSSQTSGNICLCTLSKPRKQSDSFVDDISDSSCNSSDGVLVTFSTIYNKSNNAVPANPFELNSPIEPSHGTSSLSQDGSNATPCWSPQGSDPNCNYQLDSEGVPSSPLVASDLANVLHAQTRLAVSTQNYYKLVTCDLSSQSSPSPAWSSVTSCSEGGHSQSSPTPPTEYFLFRRDDGEGGTEEVHAEHKPHEEGEQGDYGNKGANEIPCKKELKGKTSLTRSCDITTKGLLLPGKPTLPRVPSCPGHLASGGRHHVTSFAEIAHCKRGVMDTSSLRTSPDDHQRLSESQDKHGLSGAKEREYEAEHVGSASNSSTVNQDSKTPFSMDPENLPSTSKMEGACSSSPGVVRFSRDQRPTSLPIQPFILQLPPGKQQKPLGSLLNQYLSHGKSSGAHHRGKGKGKAKAVPSYLRPSPLGGYSALHLEAASSSDTCSTCTPSPVPFPHPQRMAWGFHHQQQLQCQSTPPTVDQTQSSSSSNPFRLYVSQSSPEEGHHCPKTGSEDALPPLTQTGAKQRTPEALSHIRSPSQPNKQNARELSPKMADPFQPLVPSSLGVELSQLAETASVWETCHRRPSPAVTSVTCLNTPPCLSSSPAERTPAQCSTSSTLNTVTICRPNLPSRFPGRLAQHQPQPQHQQGDSFSLTDRPPAEFCLSPDASSEALSIDLLQKKALLKAVSSAVDLITTYFEHPSRDADEKLQLGNSTLNPTIAQLVLNQLCPAIQNILLDGLRSYKLDLIVGQRRNQPWDIVLASTQPGPTTRVLHSLVSVVSKCSQLTKHSMRFNAFIMGLLNLRALEFWLNHLYTCVDVLRPLYHYWGLVPLWQGPCRPHLHELLLLLEPLASLPFDLHLLSEARLFKRTSSLLAQSAYSSLQMSAFSTNPNKGGDERKEPSESTEGRVKQESSSVYTALLSPQTFMQYISLGPPPSSRQSRPDGEPLGGSTGSDSAVGWWLKQPSVVDGVMAPSVDTQENRHTEEECERMEGEMVEERTPQELRWARLFGARLGTPVRKENKQQGPSMTQKNRLPSQWLSLDRSGLELLAQSVWSSRSGQDPNPCPNQTANMGQRNRH